MGSPASVLYYISGHGFGHARRCAETIRFLSAQHPDIPVHIRTMADARIFAGLPANCHYEKVAIDRGATEIDALNIDWQATLNGVREMLSTREPFIAAETQYIRDHNVQLIIADVPFLAGYVADAAKVPCYAQCNFMWDWIYEPHTDDQRLLEGVRIGYRLMTGQFRLPFPHPCTHFRQVIDAPFITSPLTMTRAQARERLGIRPDEHRPIILIGMRGGTEPAVIGPLARLEKDYLFIAPQAELANLNCPTPNILPWPADLRFWDVMQVCDVVMSKPGHGIVTDCATLGVGLLHPPRNGFREDPLIIGEGSRYFREQVIPLTDYQSGNWKPSLAALLTKPKPHPATNTTGREWVTQFITQHLARPA